MFTWKKTVKMERENGMKLMCKLSCIELWQWLRIDDVVKVGIEKDCDGLGKNDGDRVKKICYFGG